MGNFQDLTNQISGTLKAKEYLGNSKWLCECLKCGNEVVIATEWFNRNQRLGRDGCKHAKKIKVGDTFGFLTVVAPSDDYIKPKSKAHEPTWECLCTCGRTKVVLESNLKAYKSLTCGLCSNRVSIPEKAIVFYLQQCFDEVIENFRPDFLMGKEIDIYIPSIKLGIEYDGVRWHKNSEGDIEKNKILFRNGINVVRIREPGCPSLGDSSICIITPKTTTNATHMTVPIKQLLSYISKTYGIKTATDIDCIRDNADICKSIVYYNEERSLLSLFPEIAKEWDYDKNFPLTPDQVAAHSGRKVWWLCENGHSYSSVISSKTGNRRCSCPICSGKGGGANKNGIYIGLRNLGKFRPEIAIDFDEKKNGLSAFEIAVSSNKKVWWKCHICGHEWQAKVNNRTSSINTGCPMCSKKLNKSGKSRVKNLISKNGSLLDNHEKICEEWDYAQNDILGIKPNEVTSGSNKKVWWTCRICGHKWESSIANRAKKGSGCPRCAGRKK